MEKNKYQYRLFIDELGTANIKDIKSELYILAGCSIKDYEQQNMKIWADHIKFKYWGRTSIVFHSREIGRKENDFRVFKDDKLYGEFLSDLQKFLLHSNFKMFFVIVDKEKARKFGWNNIKIYKETSYWMVKNFLLILLTNDSKGKIIIESATAEKDFYLHKSVGHFLAEGISDLKVNYKKIQDILTSVSFVTKNNYDIEEQIADLFAYAAKCNYLLDSGGEIKKSSYEDMMLYLLKEKIFKVPYGAKSQKAKYFKEINPFLILPKQFK